MSGDLGSFDQHGNLRIEGRIKDLVIRGGHNIYPTRIESLALTHGGVAKAAAFGVADDRLGEKLCLAVIGDVDAQEILRHLVVGGAVEIRHARMVHGPAGISADSQRKDPETGIERPGAARRIGASSRCASWRKRRDSMTVDLTRAGDCALLTLNRPAALNALSFAIIRQIGDAIDRVAAMPDARALLITGAGEKSFCAGADIKELRNRALADQKRGAELGQAVFAKLDTLPIASIALVNGYAFGGGAELALACSFRLASPNAIFGLPEIKLGLIPGYGGTQRLPRLIGEGRALEIIMTGRNVKADEAERIGLVNAVIDGDLIAGGVEFAGRFTRYGPARAGIRAPRRAARRRRAAGRRAAAGGRSLNARLSHRRCRGRHGRVRGKSARRSSGMAEGQVVVTGASKGIGAAIAAELDHRGWPVVCLSRSGDSAVGHAIACDVTDETAVRAVFAQIAARGKIAGLVNNAGLHIGGAAATLSTADFNTVMALNATAVMVAAREAYPYLREHGGTIVNIGSFFDKMGVATTWPIVRQRPRWAR